jgi:hypothetical protein
MKVLESLPPELFSKLNVYVIQEELSQYKFALPGEINVIPVDSTGIRYKRQFIFDHSPHPKIIMIDDDLKFWRRTEDGKLWRPAPPNAVKIMLIEMYASLNTFAGVGIADKFMGQARQRWFEKNKKFNQVLGYNLDLMPDPRPTFWPEFGSDYNMVLQLLTRGYETCVLTEWAKSEIPWAEGGCALTRTKENNLESHQQMADYWGPDIFKIVSLTTPLRLRVSWKKAAQRGGLC